MDENCASSCHGEGTLDSFTENVKYDEDSETNLVLLWKCFSATGIHVGKSGSTHCKTFIRMYWFPIAMYFALCLNTSLLVAAVEAETWDIKIVLGCSSTNVLSIASWHSVNRNRCNLGTSIQALSEVRINKTAIVILKSILMFCSLAPSVYSILCTAYLSSNEDPSIWLYGYSAKSLYPYGTVLLFFNVNLYISLQVLFPGLCSCAYCYLCFLISRWLKECELKIGTAVVDTSFKVVVMQYFKILSTAELLENTFSTPVFLIILMHVLHMFSLLATALIYTKDQFSVPIVCEVVFIVLTSALPTLVVVICASLIPSQADKLRKRWERCFEYLVLENDVSDPVIRLAAEREIVTMTACGFITLQKKFILSVFGALFTYGFLAIQINK